MFNEKKLAVLIDSDNVSAKYAQFIMQEVAKYGTATFKRVYGDWENGVNGWHDAALNYSILPVQQTCYITGKNATDFAMIIDAMDILYTGNVDGFVLVTSDSDFTRLAIKLREAGKIVIGMGALKTPRAFTISCHHFCYLNNNCEPEFDEKAIRKTVIDFVTENKNERLDLAKVGEMLVAKYGNINFSEMGFKRLSGFIDSFPELRRSNTFVALKKEKKEISQPVIKPADITEESITAAIFEYLEENKSYSDNMMKIESYLSSRFGKIDFSRFGSKRFAKFIDKQPQLKRDGTNVSPVSKAEPPIVESITVEIFADEALAYAAANMPSGGNVGQLNNSMISKYGKAYYKTIGFDTFKDALSSVVTVTVDSNKLYVKGELDEKPATEEMIVDAALVAADVKKYAAENMPDGGNIGQLNNLLINSYGKDYCEALGYGDFKSVLASVEGVYVKKNHIFLEEPADDIPALIEESVPFVEASDIGENISEENINDEHISAESSSEQTEVEIPAEKPDFNSIRREVLHYAAVSENGGSLSGLGKVLADKYGKEILKEMGFTSMRKLAAEISGVKIKSNKLFIDEDFARQTEEIEQFVRAFASGEGSRSIRSLGIKLKKQFDGFDFKIYGYERFTDFINAIDGVKAERYHIKPVKTEG